MIFSALRRMKKAASPRETARNQNATKPVLEGQVFDLR